MRLPAASSIVLAALFGIGFGGLQREVRAQDPSRDLPAERVPGISHDEALRLGFERLRAGWNWEAARMFREVQVRREGNPIPTLLLALSMRDMPNRAARLCYEAVTNRDHAADEGRSLVDAYQAYFGVTDQPELKDERFATPPPKERRQVLIKRLRQMVAGGEGGRFTEELLSVETARQVPVVPWTSVEESVDSLHAYHVYLNQAGLMPFMVPGYGGAVKFAMGAHYQGADKESIASALWRLPRHPQYPRSSAIVRGLPGLKLEGAPRNGVAWQPRPAKSFALPRGVGGTGKFSDYEGKPVLVVFFLGFGCAHCVAQLADLDPKAPKFRDAGIEVVTIGTDDLNAVKAARQAAAENGVDPLHFDVLCDPVGTVFQEWGVWDQFAGEALHGTFLVDGKGRILWQDISARPFEESDWLLAESKRLLGAWK